MATHKVYGYCNECKGRIISVTKSELEDNSDTLYMCDHCGKHTTFVFDATKELEKLIPKVKQVIRKNENK